MNLNQKFKYISSLLIILMIIGQTVCSVGILRLAQGKEPLKPKNNNLSDIKLANNEILFENQVTLIKGCDDLIVNSCIFAFNSILNEDIRINYGTLLNLFDCNNDIIIISHGSESGILINDVLISWYELAMLLNLSQASHIYLAACCSGNIYNYTLKSGLNVISLGSISDAILIGYTLGFFINIQYDKPSKNHDAIQLYLDRYELITKNPENIQPLLCTKIREIYKWALFFPIHIAFIWEIKLSSQEVISIGGDFEDLLEYLFDYTRKIIEKFLSSGEINKYLVALLILLIPNILIIGGAINTSYNAQNQDGAWISLNGNVWPPTGAWIEGKDASGSTVYLAPLIPIDPLGVGITVYSTLAAIYHNVPDLRKWSCTSEIEQGDAEIISFPDEIQLTPCETTEISFNVKNIGPFSAGYIVEVFGLDTIDYSLFPFEIELEPDDTATIRLQLHIPCYTQPEELDFGVRVLFNGEIKEEVNSKLIILDTQPPNFELDELTIYDNEPFEYSVDILKTEGVDYVTAKLYFGGTLISGTDLPKIIDMGDKIRYIFEFPKPLTLGDYNIYINAFDASGNGRTKQTTIHYLDDDPDGPDVFINPYAQYITDAEDTFSFDVSVSDISGISSISVMFDETEIGTTPGVYTIMSPKDLGYYTASIKAFDDDNDRGEIDKAATINYTSLYIIDDDSSAPEISIDYYGLGTDGNPGYWDVYVNDPESGVAEMDVYIDGIWKGNQNGQYCVPNNLGEHEISVYAKNDDLDRPVGDQEEDTQSSSIIIIDDDVTPPSITSLDIVDDIHQVRLTIQTEDDGTGDDQGISKINVLIDENFFTFFPQSIGDIHTVDIVNLWIMQIGTHHVEIQVWDADNDRENDALESEVVSGSFETTFEEMKEYVIWEISQLIEQVIESPDEIWNQLSYKNTMVNKLVELKSLVTENFFVDAYNKLLHDIKPKLTGLKVDENGQVFDSGVFLNPWVIDPMLQGMFQTVSDKILSDLTTLASEVNKPQEFAVQGSFLRSNEIILCPLLILGFILLSLYYPISPIIRRKKKP